MKKRLGVFPKHSGFEAHYVLGRAARDNILHFQDSTKTDNLCSVQILTKKGICHELFFITAGFELCC